MNNLIYAYKKKDINKIVYVGQTINLKDRHRRHINYDPYIKDLKEYNYPLSRGIRKYGQDAYELIILEDNLKQEDLDNREKYWINYYDTYYNGYNQSIGGKNPVKPILDEEKINNVINMLKDESYSYKDIMEKTGISMTHIYNINTGKRRKRDNLEYPIRSNKIKGTKGLKFSQEECKLIHQEILKNELNIQQLAKKFNCSSSTISDIVNGKVQAYRLEGYTYPLRKSHSISKKLYWENK